jgi:hypothetical protein
MKVPIDPANKESVSDVVVSGVQVTDRVDSSKADSKSKKQVTSNDLSGIHTKGSSRAF